MTPLPRVVVRLLAARLPPRLVESVTGDIEERWQADRRRSWVRAWSRLLVVTAEVLWHARQGGWKDRRDSSRPTGDSMLREIAQDLRFSWRLAVRQPWLSAAAVVTLALGIGATTAIFSIVNAWVLTPPHFPRADRLVVIWETIPSASIFENTPAPASLHHWRARARTVSGLAHWTLGRTNLTGAGDPARLTTAQVSGELLPLLGIGPALGRAFTAEELRPNGPAVTLLTHALWTSRFAADPAVIGRQVLLSGVPTTVVGVLPPWLRLLDLDVDLWVPLPWTAAHDTDENRMLWVMARLADDASVAGAASEFESIMRGRSGGQLGARVVPLHQQVTGETGRDVLVLFAASALVLLIACANVGSLAMARMSGRRQEILVRSALGAGRMRLARQLLTESLALALAGGAAGTLLAAWALRVLVALAPGVSHLPAPDVTNPAVLLFATVAAFLASLAFGILPARRSVTLPLAPGLRETSGTLTGGGRLGLRSVLIVEVALALALLVSASLIARTYQRLTQVDLGFRPDKATAFEVPRPTTEAAAASVAFYDGLLQRVTAHPEVEAAGLIQALPLRSSAMGAGFRIEGRSGEGASILSYWRVVSAGYFDAMGIPLLAGRKVSDGDVANAPPVAVVTDSFARRAWPNEPAIGKRIGWGTLDQPMTVVGVVGDVRLFPTAPPGPHVYMPFRQWPDRLPTQLVVRSTAGTAAAVDLVRRTVAGLDPQQPVASITSMEDLAYRALRRRRFHLALFTLFAGMAVTLALVGIYGILSYMVAQMATEVGLRLALGATPRDIVLRVLGAGLRPAAAGVALGVGLALWSSGLLRGFLHGIDGRDAPTYAVAAVVLLAAAFTACLAPAIRASRTDPIASLRS